MTEAVAIMGLQNVAHLAGVCRPTVTKWVKDPLGVRPAQRFAIEAAAREMVAELGRMVASEPVNSAEDAIA